MKTSNINKPGATPQIFCKVCMIAEPKNWPIDQENSIEKTRTPRKRLKNSACFLFSPLKIWSTLHAIFWKFHLHFPQNPGPCRIPTPRATFKSQIPTLGQVFWANSRRLPGGMYPVGIDWDINGIPFWDFCTSNFQGALKIIITAKLFIVMTISPS